MNARVYLVGLGGGVLVTGALVYPCYVYLPGLFVGSWHAADVRLAWAGGALALLLLLATGALAARLSGLKGRGGAATAGALAGFLAALMAYIFMVCPAAGVWGGRDLLLYGLLPASDDIVFVSMLMDAVSMIMWWSSIAFWAAIVPGLVLGSLGGLAAGAEGRAGDHLNVLAVPMSIAGMLSALATLLVATTVYSLLPDITQKAADKVSHNLPYPAISMLVFPALASFAYLLSWQFLAWRVVRKASIGAERRPLSWDISGWLNGLMPLILALLFWLGARTTIMKYPLAALAGFLLSLAVGLPALLTVWRLRKLPRPEHTRLGWRWFLAGAAVLVGLVIVGAYIGGTGPALNLVLLPVVMIASMMPPGSAAPGTSSTNMSLTEVVKANYLGPFTLSYSLVPLIILIVVLTLAAWLVDWYGLQFASWLIARIRTPRTPADKEE